MGRLYKSRPYPRIYRDALTRPDPTRPAFEIVLTRPAPTRGNPGDPGDSGRLAGHAGRLAGHVNLTRAISHARS